MSFASAILLLAAAPSASTSFDPFALAMPGWVLCQGPVESDLKCDTLMEIEVVRPQRHIAHVRQWAPNVKSQLLYDDHIEMTDGKTCMSPRMESFHHLRFLKDGKERPAAQAPTELALLRNHFVWAGKDVKFCTSFTSEGTDISYRTEISGEARPGYFIVLRAIDGQARWVHRDDGWTVRQ